MPKTRLPTAFTNRLKKLDSETQKPVVTDEVIKSYCVLDEPTMYVRLSKPCKFICLCGQPHNSLAEAKAHIVGKGCQFLFHWVEEKKGREWFQTTKQELSLAGGEVAKCVTELVCESIGEPFPKEHWMDQPILTQEHTYQHALYLHGKRAKRMQKQQQQKQQQQKQQQQPHARAKLKRKRSQSHLNIASSQQGSMHASGQHSEDHTSDSQTSLQLPIEPAKRRMASVLSEQLLGIRF